MECEICNGRGTVWAEYMQDYEECFACSGTGWEYDSSEDYREDEAYGQWREDQT